MASSFFFLQAEKNEQNEGLISDIESWCEDTKSQAYIIDRPLGDSKYSYDYEGAIALLIPKRKIIFIDFSGDEDAFDDYVDDFIEDLGSISDKYRYKEAIGRPKKWKADLVYRVAFDENFSLEDILSETEIEDAGNQRVAELLISLLTGSINDIELVRVDVPENRLDRVKRKILLFDGDQTRFIYQRLKKNPVRIQGLSGTGKTELLMHKLKELYVNKEGSKIALTCHNKILADSLRRRIPDFFNFMKVEQQIKWNERLWCVHAWGSGNDQNSGIYRYICEYYGIPFMRWSVSTPFDAVCTIALKQIKSMGDRDCAFDFVLIDESQDFPDSFFRLCEEVTKEAVYIAGDIFQSIFDESIAPSISPDFLLSKCYRTAPHTLMFAHSLGMGLFEPEKLRWLEDKEWEACGYFMDKDEKANEYHLKREPLRRFEDLDDGASVEICPITGDFDVQACAKVVEIITRIRHENPSATADDIGIILLDGNNKIYALADMLQQYIPRQTGWVVNKAYETKRKVPDTLFVSNRNNVKGLEFPFVICLTEYIGRGYIYRNALYMTLTRSFLQSFIVLSGERNSQILPSISEGLKVIMEQGYIKVTPPTDDEIERIRTTIKVSSSNVSFYDFANGIFDELNVLPLFKQDLMETLKKTVGEDFDRENVKEVAEFLYSRMLKKDL
ncbi:DEAD/DEAH box helicase [Pseudomonas aeruginosa]|nr:AAA family ATPase [Pseudomonas aeruginosa]